MAEASGLQSWGRNRISSTFPALPKHLPSMFQVESTGLGNGSIPKLTWKPTHIYRPVCVYVYIYIYIYTNIHTYMIFICI